MSTLQAIKNITTLARARRERFEGRDHFVVPVVILVEGVHNKQYYPASELAKYPEAWNGIPIPIWHPEVDGQAVSANTPKLVEQQCVGRLFNIKYDEGKARLVGEAYIDEEKARKISPEVLDAVEAGRTLEVSTALFSDGDRIPGTWRNEQFEQTVYNFRPDHLALLPGGKGACSITDGCGLFANTVAGIKALLKNMLPGYSTRLVNEDISHDELRGKLQAQINTLDNPGWEHYVVAVYDAFFVYQALGTNPNEINSVQPVAKLYKRSFTLKDNGDVELGADPVEVKEVREYKPVDGAVANSANTNHPKEDIIMNRDAAIKALIACSHNALTAEDEPWLKTLEDKQLESLAYVPGDKPCNDDQKPQANDQKPADQKPADQKPADQKPADQKPQTNDQAPVSVDDFITNAPAEVQDVLRRAVARDKAIKADLIKKLLANKRNPFSQEELAGKDIDELTRLAEFGQVEHDFSLSRGGGVKLNDADDTAPPPPLPVFEFNKPADKTA